MMFSAARFRRGKRGLLTALAASAASLLAVAVVAPSAMAAPPYTTEATVSNLKFTSTLIVSGSDTQLSANWALPDNPSTPAGFTIDLPAEMAGRGDTFPITAEDTGATIATCVATETQLQCDFDAAYLEANPTNLKGNVYFWVKVKDSVDEETQKSYAFGDLQVTTTITPPAGPCTENCNWHWVYQKDGIYNYSDNTMIWYVHVAAPEEGMTGGQVVTVKDIPDANQELILDDNYPEIYYGNEKNAERPINLAKMSRGDFTVAADGTVTFTTLQGYFYEVRYKTKALNVGSVEEYTNKAEFTINGRSDGSVEGSSRYAGGGGTGIGTNAGVFTIAKSVEGSAVNLPGDLTFTGTYSVATPDGQTLTGTYSVKAGETWRSEEFPRDSVVTLTEDTPTSPENVTWGAPSFSSNDFTLPGGKLTPVTLTNTADVRLATFSASKSITGTEDAQVLVPSDATFTLDYSYPAGPGFEAGSGSLTLSADGTVATSPELPVGAEMTVTEQAPTAVDGISWGTPVISPSTFTISDDTAVAVTVENPVTETLGGFSLKKSVSGDASGLVPEGTTFLVDYAWVSEDGAQQGNGTLEVVAGGEPVTAEGIPGGATVTLTEQTPSTVSGVSWVDPVFSQNGFTVIAGQVIEIDLDNPTQLNSGAIALQKKLDGSGAADVPASTEFTVNYSYAAGDGFDAGKGSITVRADGVVVTSDPLPFGAVVTFEEATPPAVDGITWKESSFDVESVTVGDGTVSQVVLTNTAEKVVVPPIETPTTPANALANTGSDWNPTFALTGAAALIALGALMVARRRKVSAE